MARMHTRRKGQAGSRHPSTMRVPEWLDKEKNARWVEEKVIELAKAGNTPSMIGMTLRDQYGVPLVKVVTGKSVDCYSQGARPYTKSARRSSQHNNQGNTHS